MEYVPIFSDILSDKEWLIEGKDWQQDTQQVREAHFTLGNGIIGSRGILEEIPYDANAGTFIAGIYDRFGALIPEIVNLPNPIVFRSDVEGEKLDPVAMDVLNHYRALDMKKGLLVRNTLYRNIHKNRIAYQSYRFISLYQRFIGAMVVAMTPLDKTMQFNVSSILDTSVSNRGVLSEGRKKHYEVSAVSRSKMGNYTEVQTFEHQHVIGYAMSLEVIHRGREWTENDSIFKIKIQKGETAKFILYFTIVPSFYCQRKKQVRKIAEHELRRGKQLGVERLLKSHVNAWKKAWDIHDIIITGSNKQQKAIRFNLYHLIIAANRDDRVSVGARTLSGEGYRGHIFWDAEIFVYPFYVFTNPHIARSMLLYRWHRLDPARKIAIAKGYKGACFPWESADTGEETTPEWARGIIGELIPIDTGKEEHHIVADIAYAIHQYFMATGDEEFMCSNGLEMLFETARFWLSRFKLNKEKHRYEMYKIMGPDEFHKNTKNNAFTSEMARFNLEIAAYWYEWAKHRRFSKIGLLKKKIGLKDSEVTKWKEVAEKIYVPYSKKKKIIEQFDGYLKLKDVRITQLDRFYMPIIPPQAHPVENGKTQLIKQADVVMLLYLLRHRYTKEEMQRNYEYYERRTLHKSSLSSSIHSIMAARIGALDKALLYLSVSLNGDLLDIHGNAAEGFHAASGGGLWQALVMGFGGMDVHENKIVFNPILPPTWKSLAFNVFWLGASLKVEILKNAVNITRMDLGIRKQFVAEVAGIQRILPVRDTITFQI